MTVRGTWDRIDSSSDTILVKGGRSSGLGLQHLLMSSRTSCRHGAAGRQASKQAGRGQVVEGAGGTATQRATNSVPAAHPRPCQPSPFSCDAAAGAPQIRGAARGVPPGAPPRLGPAPQRGAGTTQGEGRGGSRAGRQEGGRNQWGRPVYISDASLPPMHSTVPADPLPLSLHTSNSW